MSMLIQKGLEKVYDYIQCKLTMVKIFLCEKEKKKLTFDLSYLHIKYTMKYLLSFISYNYSFLGFT